ncbi:MAG: monovalent cation/H(+) antiporter subunit G [Burkholderiaceae bacterium]|jgi:multicomponent K+:H+ antiporter subunit G|nr:monovalent cation/H(+) antiporter subunit G [Burkholderiaceae bacterium]
MTPQEASLSLWVEIIVGVLLLLSAVLALASAFAMARLRTFFLRMHPPTLTSVGAVWCVTAASLIYFSALNGALALHVWLIVVLMSITTPITTVLLARAALFRLRAQKTPGIPPPIQLRVAPVDPET